MLSYKMAPESNKYLIKELKWDSTCFGYSVGCLMLDHNDGFLPEDIFICNKNFRLLYVFSKVLLKSNDKKLKLVDTKLMFCRKAETLEGKFQGIRSYFGPLKQELLNLALSSGEFSRFKTDSSFENDEYYKLYREWIINSLNRKIAIDLFVYYVGDGIKGFVSLTAKKHQVEIGLIAVDKNSRGQGIGRDLINYAINYAALNGYMTIKVATQEDNKPAVALYRKLGFELIDLTYVYHYWNI